MENYYLNRKQLEFYFPVEDTILSDTKAGIVDIFARKLSLSSKMVSKFFNEAKIQEVKINNTKLHFLKKHNHETWGAFFFNFFYDKFNNLSWETLKQELSKEMIGVTDNPKTITELFNKPEILTTISDIKSKIKHPQHPSLSQLDTAKFKAFFNNITFYKEQERAIKEGVNAWMLKKHNFFFLGEMGVGKTICTTAMVETTKRLRNTPHAKTLVVAPDHLLEKWKAEILLVSPYAKVKILDGEQLIDLLPKDTTFRTDSWKREKGNHSFESHGMKLDADYYLLPQSLLSIVGTIKYKEVLLLEAVFKHRSRQDFTYAIWDESHLLAKPAYSINLQHLAKLSKYNVLATGTSIAGSVSDLFPQALAFFPEDTIQQKEELNYYRTSTKVKWISMCEKAFVKKYGSYSYNANGRNATNLPGYKPEIGISSEFITHFILPNSIFLTTEQVWEDKVEHLIFPPILVEMSEAQKLAMYSLTEIAHAAANQGNKRLFGSYLRVANEYLDNPSVKDISFKGELLWSPVPFQLIYHFNEQLLPKEEKLIEICEMERSQDRPVVVFVKHLERLKKRLKEVLSNAGFKVGALPDSVKATDRQDYINKKFLNEKMDLMLVNPAKVATGTDLLSAPTVLFFNTGFSYFEVGQSERRSYRIGQKRQTRVYYLGYKGAEEQSVQEQVLYMIAEKKRAMESIQGNIDEEGLSALLGKQQSSLLKQLVNNMNQEQACEQKAVIGQKQAYYMSHFGERLSVEDEGRPRLNENLQFIWSNVENDEKRKINSPINFTSYKKKGVEVVINESISPDEIDDNFDQNGELSLFDLLLA